MGASSQIFVDTGTPVVTFSCIQGGWPGAGGTGNINTDPRFVRNPDDGGDGWGVGGNDDFGNLHLLCGSPCIDAGNDTAVPADAADLDGDVDTAERVPFDLDGNPRFVDDADTVDTGVSDPPNYPEVVDMGVYEAMDLGLVLFVDAGATGANDGTSWADAYTNLQDALQRSCFSDEVRVAAGAYSPDGNVLDSFGAIVHAGSGDRSATFQLVDDFEILGGYPPGGGSRDPTTNETILSGDLNNDDDTGGNGENSYHVVTGSGTNATAILDGFTVTAGHANGGGADSSGAGMYSDNGSSTIANCAFLTNIAADDGGGIYSINNSSLVVTDCGFTENDAVRWGGGLYNSDSTPTLISCTFHGNTAGDVGAGIFNVRSNAVVTNCAFVGNSTVSVGGGMYNTDADPTVTNCTFSGNAAALGAGIFNAANSGSTVTNCVLWGNTASGVVDETAQLRVDPSEVSPVTFSCIQDADPNDASIPFGGAANGNIDDDPLLVRAPDPGPDGTWDGVDDDFGDLRVLTGSPCLDAADNSADTDANTPGVQPLPPTDLDGDPRFVDDPDAPDTGSGTPPIVDMGAYEGAYEVPAVPAMSAWSLAAMTLLLLAPGAILIRRCRLRVS